MSSHMCTALTSSGACVDVELHCSAFATVRKIFRNGDVKTNETGKVSNVEETDAWTGFTVFRRAQDPFERARAMDLELDLELLRSFIAQRIVEAEETVQSGKVAKTVDIRKVSPEIRALMMEARAAEWCHSFEKR